MMKRLALLGAFLLLAVAVALFTGCSDDDEATNPSLQQGDTLDPTFIAFKEAYGGVDEFTGLMMNVLFNLVDTVMVDTANPNNKPVAFPVSLDIQADSLLITYHPSSQYWYFYIVESSGVDSVELIDSIQFVHGTTPVQWPDLDQLSELKSGMSLYYGMGELLATASQSISMNGDFPTMGDVTVSGSQQVNIAFIANNLYMEGDSMFCYFDFAFGSEFDDVVVAISDFNVGCPSSGKIVATGSGNINCHSDTDTLSHSGNWTVTQTFDGDSTTWVFEDGTTRWTQTESCGPSVLKPSIMGYRPSIFTDVR